MPAVAKGRPANRDSAPINMSKWVEELRVQVMQEREKLSPYFPREHWAVPDLRTADPGQLAEADQAHIAAFEYLRRNAPVQQTNQQSNMTLPEKRRERLAMLTDLDAQCVDLRQKCLAADGCPEQLPPALPKSQDALSDSQVEQAIEQRQRFIANRQFQMSHPGFSAGTLAGRAASGPRANAPAFAQPTDLRSAAAVGIVGLSQISPAQVGFSPAQNSLLGEWQAVQHDPRQRSEFIRTNEKALLALAIALEGDPVAQAEPAADAARPGATTAEDEKFAAQWQAVEQDPVQRSVFLRKHQAEVQSYLLRHNN
jgi:hypothetical protein